MLEANYNITHANASEVNTSNTDSQRLASTEPPPPISQEVVETDRVYSLLGDTFQYADEAKKKLNSAKAWSVAVPIAGLAGAIALIPGIPCLIGMWTRYGISRHKLKKTEAQLRQSLEAKFGEESQEVGVSIERISIKRRQILEKLEKLKWGENHSFAQHLNRTLESAKQASSFKDCKRAEL